MCIASDVTGKRLAIAEAKRLVVLKNDGTQWDIFKELGSSELGKSNVHSMSWNLAGTRLALLQGQSVKDSQITVWDTKDDKLNKHPIYIQLANNLGWRPGREEIVFGQSGRRHIWLYSINKKKKKRLPISGYRPVWLDENRLLAIYENVRIYEIISGKILSIGHEMASDGGPAGIKGGVGFLPEQTSVYAYCTWYPRLWLRIYGSHSSMVIPKVKALYGPPTWVLRQ